MKDRVKQAKITGGGDKQDQKRAWECRMQNEK